MAAETGLSWNRTKLIATLGPASSSTERIGALLDAGADVFRLNFSHGTLAAHEAALRTVRELAAERQSPVAMLGDLSGPKIRLGEFEAPGAEIAPGQQVHFVRGGGQCTAERWTTTYATFVDEVQEGQRVYIDDGLVRLLVVERRDDELVARCTVGGRVSSHKGVNLPDTKLSVPALTEKDRADLEWVIEHQLDYVALSFVRQPDDLRELRRLLEPRGRGIGVISKIEKVEALDHLDELIDLSDAVLVARGDLGVETDVWRVPLIQKDLTARCRRAGVPVIVATQMLQSMVHSPMPTRAEVSDVANAILDGADAVMLSAETAVGEYPAQALAMLNRVSQVTEQYVSRRPRMTRSEQVSASGLVAAAIAHGAAQAALDLGARAVAAWTATGTTVRLLAQHRLPMPVVGLTSDERVWRQMSLLFGVVPLRAPALHQPAKMARELDSRLRERGLAAKGDLVIVVTSTRPETPGATDTTLVHRVGGD